MPKVTAKKSQGGQHETQPAEYVSLAGKLAASRAKDTAPHVVVEARAGSGKTTTLVTALKRLKGLDPGIVPSPQQQAVWDAVGQSKNARSVGFVAFNKSIADELKQRVPAGCEAMTLHSLGNAAVRQAFPRAKLNQYRVSDIVGKTLELDPKIVRREYPGLINTVERLVGLCKMNLIGLDRLKTASDAMSRIDLTPDYVTETLVGIDTEWEEDLQNLADHYDVDLDAVNKRQVFSMVPIVLQRCLDIAGDNEIDFNDMVWLPVVLNLPTRKYDLLMVDEYQDTNRCSQALARKAGSRLILCGDPRQAIYGFAGADAQAMERMTEELKTTDRGCVVLPLTVTRRCGKAIVREANKIVVEFHAHESNPDGEVRHALFENKTPTIEQSWYQDRVKEGDFVLCRANAPLVKECFRFIKAGRKANIQGRDIGQGLISTITKMKVTDIKTLTEKLDVYFHNEVVREQAKRNPSETRIDALTDRKECLECFVEGSATVQEVINKIEAVFTDDKQGKGIRLSSIHRSKGLEADRVFLLQPKGSEVLPEWLVNKPAWEQGQARNLLYVAITRAISELVYVS